MSASSPHLQSFFQQDGRTVIVPVDHGTAIPVTPGLGDLGGVITRLRPWADGFVVNYGAARAFRKELQGKGVCLRADVYKPATPGNPDHGAYMTCGAEEAKRVEAHGLMSMLYPHHPDEMRITKENAWLLSECHEAGLPLIVESLPYGLGQTAKYTPENIAFAVRSAAELGADVVKTAWCGDAGAFREIVAACFVPVIVLGGAALGDDAALLTMVEQSIAAGGAGIAIGRNVWQHPDPALIVRKLHAVVHEGATAADADRLTLNDRVGA